MELKFTLCKDLHDKLLATENAHLIYYDTEKINIHGFMLMSLRDKLNRMKH